MKTKMEIYDDYLKGLLNAYKLYKKQYKKTMNSLCYYIKKGNNKMIQERWNELNRIKDTLHNHEEDIIHIYRKLSGERLVTNNRTFGIKEINIIRKFLNS